MGEINILCNNYNLPSKTYNSILHLIHWRVLFNCDIIKSNQTNGSEIALKAAKFWRKPFIGRMGFVLSEFQLNRKGKDSSSYNNALEIESSLIKQADRIVVTTDEMKKKLIQIHNITKRNKIVIIPNYVDTKLFSPNCNKVEKTFDLIFIGRVEKQKNIKNLLKAITQLKIKSLIIGMGSLKNELLDKYNSPLIQWIDKVDNETLPEHLNDASIFILPSFYEGHPKTLIEAMSSGTAVIGANRPGIKNIISNKVNGILCDISEDAISKEIYSLLSTPDLRNNIGKNARKFVIKHFSLDRIVKLELDVYNDLIP